MHVSYRFQPIRFLQNCQLWYKQLLLYAAPHYLAGPRPQLRIAQRRATESRHTAPPPPFPSSSASSPTPEPCKQPNLHAPVKRFADAGVGVGTSHLHRYNGSMSTFSCTSLSDAQLGPRAGQIVGRRADQSGGIYITHSTVAVQLCSKTILVLGLSPSDSDGF